MVMGVCASYFWTGKGRGAAGDAAINSCNFCAARWWMGACFDRSKGGFWSSESSKVTTVGLWEVTGGLSEGEGTQKKHQTYAQIHYPIEKTEDVSIWRTRVSHNRLECPHRATGPSRPSLLYRVDLPANKHNKHTQ